MLSKDVRFRSRLYLRSVEPGAIEAGGVSMEGVDIESRCFDNA